ncbi:hypothetical protein TRFO_21513 [Tritrichomonas foetus]|uniref:Uncharacterized protein n=1 Tax=Tritrichomonas foetus TaxID=1144522 RepID=A0A1J4KIA6_9EUKA|nr:hypothetical protein TRFO_21513 [Tritrichomonas foetus]|eukprot:OHT09556.1 hypothetical protein TRFO_21513 [Tritrichomonas foetus]
MHTRSHSKPQLQDDLPDEKEPLPIPILNTNKPKNTRENYFDEEIIFDDQMKTHYSLEVLEFRIHFDQDPLHEHPAKCISVLEELPNHEITEMTEEEQDMKQNYQQLNFIPIVPNFWPGRVYDHDESLLLTDQQSEELAAQIKAATEGRLYQKKKKPKKSSSTERLYEDDEKNLPFDIEPEIIHVHKTPNQNLERRRRPLVNHFLKSRKILNMLRLPTLLYDTDEECDETDGEMF